MKRTNSAGFGATQILIAAIVVIILVGAIVFAVNKKGDEEAQESAKSESMEGSGSSIQPTQGPTIAASNYKDGKYQAIGEYSSPGGQESLNVNLTLKSGVVTDANVTTNVASGPTAKRMQESFIGGFKSQVVGKKINDIHLTKVAASSLTPNGFNSALEKIKAKASS